MQDCLRIKLVANDVKHDKCQLNHNGVVVSVMFGNFLTIELETCGLGWNE